ncbi:hypothetical protein BRIN106911_04290 [Brevibacillus invocatus]
MGKDMKHRSAKALRGFGVLYFFMEKGVRVIGAYPSIIIVQLIGG